MNQVTGKPYSATKLLKTLCKIKIIGMEKHNIVYLLVNSNSLYQAKPGIERQKPEDNLEPL